MLSTPQRGTSSFGAKLALASKLTRGGGFRRTSALPPELRRAPMVKNKIALQCNLVLHVRRNRTASHEDGALLDRPCSHLPAMAIDPGGTSAESGAVTAWARRARHCSYAAGELAARPTCSVAQLKTGGCDQASPISLSWGGSCRTGAAHPPPMATESSCKAQSTAQAAQSPRKVGCRPVRPVVAAPVHPLVC
jgi:hypothetical protein